MWSAIVSKGHVHVQSGQCFRTINQNVMCRLPSKHYDFYNTELVTINLSPGVQPFPPFLLLAPPSSFRTHRRGLLNTAISL